MLCECWGVAAEGRFTALLEADRTSGAVLYGLGGRCWILRPECCVARGEVESSRSGSAGEGGAVGRRSGDGRGLDVCDGGRWAALWLRECEGLESGEVGNPAAALLALLLRDWAVRVGLPTAVGSFGITCGVCVQIYV